MTATNTGVKLRRGRPPKIEEIPNVYEVHIYGKRHVFRVRPTGAYPLVTPEGARAVDVEYAKMLVREYANV